MGIPAGTSVGPYDTLDYVYAETLVEMPGALSKPAQLEPVPQEASNPEIRNR